MIKNLFVAAFMAILSLFSPLAKAEYSATMVVTSPTNVSRSSVYVKGDWRRQEQPDQVIIFNSKSGKTYALMEDQKTYIEMGDDQSEEDDVPKDMEVGQVLEDEDGRTERLPSERLQGYLCHRYRLTSLEDQFGPSDLWFSPELRTAIKVVSETPMGVITLEYENIREDVQDPALFEIPKGYNKLELDL